MLNPFSRFLLALIAAASITRCDKPAFFSAFQKKKRKRNCRLCVGGCVLARWASFEIKGQEMSGSVSALTDLSITDVTRRRVHRVQI